MAKTKIIIFGQVPSLKNNKQIAINRRTGSTFITSSKKVKDWQENALEQLKMAQERFYGRVQIDYMFYVKDNVQRDIDNMMATVNDILQIANADTEYKRGKLRPVKGTGIIKGDNWQLLRVGSADAEIDKENPRCELTITEL